MPSLRAERAGAALVVSLDHPPRNVLDRATLGELMEVLSTLGNANDTRMVVLRSALPGVFSAGVDVSDHAAEKVDGMLRSFHGVLRLIDHLPQVAIAAVDGLCLGGAFELASFCDVVLATPTSSFGQPEIDLGCFPPAATALLPTLAGKLAFDVVLTGRRLTAVEAAHAGLVTRVVDDLPAETERWRVLLESKSAKALAAARRALRATTRPAFEQALAEAEQIYRGEVARSADAAEGIRAFYEKRAPRWSHS